MRVCAFCGQELTQEGIEKACRGCGAFGGCHLIKCPACGYEQPQEPRWLQKLVAWVRRRQPEPIRVSPLQEITGGSEPLQRLPLTALQAGSTARIVHIVQDSEGHWRKLTALGIMPGAVVRLVQKFPSYVLQIGYTTLALDHQLTAQIEVEPLTTESEP
jgi:Fe2+ transport system protein FeoA